jgi:hypothetical protein
MSNIRGIVENNTSFCRHLISRELVFFKKTKDLIRILTNHTLYDKIVAKATVAYATKGNLKVEFLKTGKAR